MNPDQSPAAEGIDLAALDIVGLVLVLLLALLGLWRGLWWQVIRLVGIVAAVALSRAFAATLATPIAERWPDLSDRLTHGIAWIGIFLGTMAVATLLGFLGNRLIQAMQLGFANRVGGAAAGALTGGLVHLALLVALVQLGPEGFVQRTVAGTYSERLYETFGSRWSVVMNEEAATEVDLLLQKARQFQTPPLLGPSGTNSGAPLVR